MARKVLQLKTLKAFPTATGGGAESTGGRGKLVGVVNTLDFEQGATQRTAPNGDTYFDGGLLQLIINEQVGYIVFTVSGDIHMPVGGMIRTGIKKLSILGQTAPRGGVTITGGTVRFYDGGDDPEKYDPPGDHIFRYFRSRPIIAKNGMGPEEALTYDFKEGDPNASGGIGDDAYTWGVKWATGDNIILDHCSVSHSYDKNIGGGPRAGHESMVGYTISHCLSADGSTNTYFSTNAGRDQGPPPAQSAPDNISVISNLMSFSNRTPQMGFNGYGEVYNNVIFDIPYKYTSTAWACHVNYIGNYYKGENQWTGDGGSSFARNRVLSTHLADEPDAIPQMYLEGNYAIRENDTVYVDGVSGQDGELWCNYLDGLSGNPPPFNGPNLGTFLADTQHPSNITHQYIPYTCFEAYDRVVVQRDVGAYKYIDDNNEVQEYRDDFDSLQLLVTLNNDTTTYKAKTPENWVLPAIPNNTRPAGFYAQVVGIPQTFCDTHGITSIDDIIPVYEFEDYVVVNDAGYNAIEMYSNLVDYEPMISGYQRPDSSFEVYEEAGVLAFPSAIGGGAYTTGGRGGIVVHVTTLEDDGRFNIIPGSLRWALRMTQPRVIVFDVSGTIVLKELLELVLEHSNFTVLGQTAPRGGITISGSSISHGGGYYDPQEPCNNAIWRYIRFRNTLAEGDCCVAYNEVGLRAGGGAGTIIVDHCTFSYNHNKAFSAGGNYGPTTGLSFTRNMLYDNGTGLLIGSVGEGNYEQGNFTVAQNLFVDQSHRHPNASTTLPYDIINNVVIGYGNRSVNVNQNASMDLNYIGNYIEQGPDADWTNRTIGGVNQLQEPATPKIFTANNYHNLHSPIPQLNDEILWTEFSGDNDTPLNADKFVQVQHPLVGARYDIMTPFEAYDSVLADVGTNKYLNADGTWHTYIDDRDQEKFDNIANKVFSDTRVNPDNYILPVLPENVRPADYYQTDPDVPQEWFVTNVPYGSSGTDIDPNTGRMYIENFANGVDAANIFYPLDPIEKRSGSSRAVKFAYMKC